MLKQLIHRLRQKIEIDPAAPRLIVTTPHAGYRFETQGTNYTPRTAQAIPLGFGSQPTKEFKS